MRWLGYVLIVLTLAGCASVPRIEYLEAEVPDSIYYVPEGTKLILPNGKLYRTTKNMGWYFDYWQTKRLLRVDNSLR